MKPTSALVGPNDPVVLPQGSVKSDWEVELGVVIGTKARYVSEADALKYVAGYCVVNDVSEREYQIERGGTWDKGKGCDTFGPVGPWMVTADEIENPQELAMWLDVNGKRCQNGSTKTMIFGVANLVSYCSRFMTLYPGDLISHRHAARRRPRHEAADLPEGRRRDARRHRPSRRAAPARLRLGPGADRRLMPDRIARQAGATPMDMKTRAGR